MSIKRCLTCLLLLISEFVELTFVRICETTVQSKPVLILQLSSPSLMRPSQHLHVQPYVNFLLPVLSRQMERKLKSKSDKKVALFYTVTQSLQVGCQKEDRT